MIFLLCSGFPSPNLNIIGHQRIGLLIPPRGYINIYIKNQKLKVILAYNNLSSINVCLIDQLHSDEVVTSLKLSPLSLSSHVTTPTQELSSKFIVLTVKQIQLSHCFRYLQQKWPRKTLCLELTSLMQPHLILRSSPPSPRRSLMHLNSFFGKIT